MSKITVDFNFPSGTSAVKKGLDTHAAIAMAVSSLKASGCTINSHLVEDECDGYELFEFTPKDEIR